MILSLIALAALAQDPTNVQVIEGVRPDVIRVEAFVKLPPLGPHELAAMRLVTDTLLEDIQDIGKQELLERTSVAGDTIGVELLPDAVRLHFAVLATEADSVASILDNVLHGSKPSEEVLTEAQQEAPFAQKSPWDSAINPERPNIGQVRLGDVYTTYRRFFKPDKIFVEIEAPLAAMKTDFASQWKTRYEAWEQESLPMRLVDKGRVPVLTERSGQLTTIVLRAPAVPARQSSMAILTSFALGGGKGAVVFQALREGLGWSYRQEAPVRGVADGLEQTVVVITKTSPQDFEHAQAVRPAMLAAIDKWTEADRVRAVGAAKAWLLRGVGIDPLNFFGLRPDPAYVQGYWRMKSGSNFDIETVVSGLEAISLDALKANARAEIEAAGLEVIRGKD